MASGEPAGAELPPMPVTRFVLVLVNLLSTRWCVEEWVYRRWNLGPRSSFVEYLVVGRLGVAVALLYGGYLPAYLLGPKSALGLLAAGATQLAAAYLIVNTLAAQLRIQLLDRAVGQSATDHGRNLVLNVLNVLQLTVLFAAVYQSAFYAHRDLSPDKAPLIGGGLARTAGEHPDLILRPADALYYSVVTFATVGYGDIGPNVSALRAVVGAEIACSILSLVVVLALCIGLVRPRNEEPQRELYAETWDKRLEYLRLLAEAPDHLDARRKRNYRIQRGAAIVCWLVALVCVAAHLAVGVALPS